MSEERDPCGDCVVCQTKMIAALASQEMRVFLAEIAETHLIRVLMSGEDEDEWIDPLVGFIVTMVPEEAPRLMANLAAAGVVVIEKEDD